MIRWEPIREISSLRRALDRFMDDSSVPAVWQSDELRTLTPPVDIFERESDVLVKAVVPGVSGDDLNIEVMGDTRTIRGESGRSKRMKRKIISTVNGVTGLSSAA